MMTIFQEEEMEALNLAKDEQPQSPRMKSPHPSSSPHFAPSPSPPLPHLPNPTLQAALVALQAGQLSLSQVNKSELKLLRFCIFNF